MKKTLLLLSGVFALTVTSCKTAGEITTVQVEKTVDMSKHLEGEWVLSSITTPSTTGKEMKTLFSMKQPSLKFEVKDKKVYGNDGCNNIHGSFELKANNGIAVGDKMASTMMFCEGVADRDFMQGLKTVTNYDVVDGQLILSSGDVVIMTFNKK